MSYTSTGVNAGLILIGNELLSGKTKDANMNFIANFLGDEAIDLVEVVVIPDIEATIISKVQEFSERFDYVFTTGGIGPTHDDITAGSIAKAFDLELEINESAKQTLTEFYKEKINESRLSMARMPKGSTLICNDISIAPGFKIKNVYVMAGIPRIMQSMLQSLKGNLDGGKKIHSHTYKLYTKESDIADFLYELDEKYKDKIEIGSYPFKEEKPERYGTNIVFRSNNQAFIQQASSELYEFVSKEFGEDHIFSE